MPRTKVEVDCIESLTVMTKEAAALVGISRAQFHKMFVAGKVGPNPLPIGGQRYLRSEIVEWVQARCPDNKTWQSRKPEADDE